MNKYQSVIIVNPNVDDDKLKELEKNITDLINKAGKVEKIEELGKKKLAYQVKKNTEGIYVAIYFDGEPTLIAELERNYRIMDDIIKFIDVRID